MIPEAERPGLHLATGRILLESLSAEIRQERLFAVVNHLNLGRSQISDREERAALLELNQQAAHKAQRSNAYNAAFEYFQTALSLLGESGWEQSYQLTLTLHSESALAAFLAHDLPASDSLVDAVLANARTLLDKIDAYTVRMQALIGAARWWDAAKVGFGALQALGAAVPVRTSRTTMLWHYVRLSMLLMGRTKTSLVNAPAMTDPYRLAEMRILTHVVTAIYFSRPSFSPLLIMRAVETSVRHGNSQYAAFAYASYGSFLCRGLGRMERGREFGELALEVLDRFDTASSKPKVMNLVQSHVNHWSGSLKETLGPIREGFEAGMAAGDLEYASLSAIVHVYTAFLSGVPLAEVESLAADYAEVARGGSRDSILLRRQLVLNLLGRAEDPCLLQGEACDEHALLPDLLESNQVMGLLTYSSAKATLSYLLGDPEDALRHADDALKNQRSSAGISTGGPLMLLHALISLRLYPEQIDEEKARLLKRVKHHLQKLRVLARHALVNHRSRVSLIEAEICRVANQADRAAKLYDVAIDQAKADGLLLEEALANELAGRFFLDSARRQLAFGYLREAREVYARWGAAAKVSQLESAYPYLTDSGRVQGQLPGNSATTVTGSFSIDLKGLMRALKDIGSEQVHSRLLEKTITTAMEVAGAQTALLFLPGKADRMTLEAEASVSSDKPRIMQSVPLDECSGVSPAVINYVIRTLQTVVIHDAQEPQTTIPGLNEDPHVRAHGVRSILCVPLLAGTNEAPELGGLLYLENNAATHTFVERVREPLEIICLSASGRIELARRAVTDLLTNLYNHDYLQGVLQKETAAAERSGRPLSLVMIDIDHFKNFNDRYGHQAGDRVLAEVAALIKDTTRKSDVVARYGGEEMAVVLPDADLEVALEAAERIRGRIEQAGIAYEEEILHVTASFGVTTQKPGDSDPASLVKAADQALYRSKDEGRNRVSAG